MSLEGLLDLPIGVWVTVAVLLFWAVGAYNRLVRLRVAAVQAFSLLESQWLKHLAWIEVQWLHSSEDAAAPVAAAVVAEQQRPDLHVLQPAVAQFRACLQAAKLGPLKSESLGSLSSAWTVFRMAIRQVQADDDAGVPRLPQVLSAHWEQMLLQDQAAVDVFNEAVQRYNQAIRQFPAILLAWVFAYRAARSI